MGNYASTTSGRDDGADQAVTLADLRDMLAVADIAVVALPLTRATRGLIGAAELAVMKPDAILVNVARGAIVDEDALFARLQAHPDFCAGIDTWWDEPGYGRPFRPRLPFLSLPNVLGSPHNSGIVPGMVSESMVAAARNVVAYLAGEPVRGFVADYVTHWLETDDPDEAHYPFAVLNAPAVDKAIKPYQTKGAFGAQHGKGERHIHRRPLQRYRAV